LDDNILTVVSTDKRSPSLSSLRRFLGTNLSTWWDHCWMFESTEEYITLKDLFHGKVWTRRPQL
jgi:hypothetical protein